MKPFFTLLIILFPLAIFAQSNYHQGYVVKNNDDTLKGYINYREWTKCPKSIEFRENKNDKKTLLFNPKSIRKFQITGMETYITYKGLVSMNITDLQYIKEILDTAKKQDTVFLQQLEMGKNVTLFYYGDEIKDRYFISRKNETPVELMYYAYYRSSQLVTIETYRGQLTPYAKEFLPQSDAVVKKIDRAKYEQQDLVNIVNKINNNGIAIKKKSSSVRLFAGVDLSATKTTIAAGLIPSSYVNSTALSNTRNSTTTVLPKISAGVDFFNNENVQQFIFRAELSLFYINPQLKYANPDAPNQSATFDYYSINQYTAAVTPQLIFNIFNKENFKIFIDAGIAFNFSAYASNYKHSVTTSGQSPQTDHVIKDPFKLEPLWANLPLKAGVKINKKLEFDFTYIGDKAYTKSTGFTVSNQSINLGAKYFFGKE